MARMGRKIEDPKKCRPLIVKFYREDRQQCRLLIKKAKKEKEKTGEADKYIYKVRGEPGSFHVALVRRPNFSH